MYRKTTRPACFALVKLNCLTFLQVFHHKNRLLYNVCLFKTMWVCVHVHTFIICNWGGQWHCAINQFIYTKTLNFTLLSIIAFLRIIFYHITEMAVVFTNCLYVSNDSYFCQLCHFQVTEADLDLAHDQKEMVRHNSGWNPPDVI